MGGSVHNLTTFHHTLFYWPHTTVESYFPSFACTRLFKSTQLINYQEPKLFFNGLPTIYLPCLMKECEIV